MLVMMSGIRPATAAGYLPGWGYPVFQDEFNGSANSAPDSAKWSTLTDNDGSSGNTVCNFLDRMAYHDGEGNLVLKANSGETGGFGASQYASAQISTAGKFEQAYGRWEFRAKMPAGGSGIWPGLWMFRVDVQWPPEIDVLEMVSDMGVLYTNYHYDSGGHQQTGPTSHADSALATGFHVYHVEWEPGEIRWYVDGVLVNTHTNANVASIPMNVVLDFYLGGSWAGSPDGTTFPQYMYIDYVRVYEAA